MHDLRLAFRSLRKSWTVTLLTTASLALAIGGNSTVFSLIDAFLFRTLPYHDPDRLLMLWESRRGTAAEFPTLSPANFVDLKQRSRLLKEFAAFRTVPLNWRGEDRSEQLVAAAASVNLFSLLGVQPLQGRNFRQEEGRRGQHRVVILSHRFWETRLGGNPGVLGNTITLDTEPFTIIGIMGSKFELISPTIQLWIPLLLDAGDLPRSRRDLLAFTRLPEAVPLEEARAEITVLARRLEQEYPDHNRGYETRIDTMRNRLVDSRNRQLFGLLQGALLFVLLISCANIANLLLARGHHRQRELAIRAALGATRTRLIRQLLTESLLLALLGGVPGVVLAAAGIRVLNLALSPVLPNHYAPQLDLHVVFFTLGITAISGLLFGLAPALQATRLNLLENLKEGGHGAAMGRRRGLLNRLLVVAEVSLALVLLGGASVLIRSFAELQNVDAGFQTDNLLTMQLSLPPDRYRNSQQVLDFFEALLERLQSLPGVEAASLTNSLPRSPFSPSTTFSIDDQPWAGGEQAPTGIWLSVPPSYLETLQIPLLRGRNFSPKDVLQSAPVVLISQALARRYWPRQTPLGRRLTIHGHSREIVGVVADVQQDMLVSEQGFPLVIYLPQAQFPVRTASALLRTAVDPASVSLSARRTVEQMDLDVSVGQLLTLEEFVAQFFVGAHIFTITLSAFGMVALLLAAIGIYGVLSYSVAQRTHEIGVRLALGAGPRQIVGLILRQGLIPVLAGFALGLPGLLAVSRVIASIMTGIAPVAPRTMAAAGLFLLLVTLVAIYLPARRACSVQPIRALRYQ